MNDELVTAPLPYARLLARNIAAARTVLHLRQSDLSERMREQDVPWYPQTVSEAEAGRRAVRAAELLPLAIALETTVWALTAAPPGTIAVALPSGEVISARRVVEVDESAVWDGNRLKVTPPSRRTPLIESLIAERRREAEALEAYREELRRSESGDSLDDD